MAKKQEKKRHGIHEKETPQDPHKNKIKWKQKLAILSQVLKKVNKHCKFVRANTQEKINLTIPKKFNHTELGRF